MTSNANSANPEEKRQRTCVSCRNSTGRSTLLRIVRSPEGEVAFDKSGKAAGRGAYVCSLDCLQAALDSKKLERALKVPSLSDDCRATILREATNYKASQE